MLIMDSDLAKTCTFRRTLNGLGACCLLAIGLAVAADAFAPSEAVVTTWINLDFNKMLGTILSILGILFLWDSEHMHKQLKKKLQGAVVKRATIKFDRFNDHGFFSTSESSDYFRVDVDQETDAEGNAGSWETRTRQSLGLIFRGESPHRSDVWFDRVSGAPIAARIRSQIIVLEDPHRINHQGA